MNFVPNVQAQEIQIGVSMPTFLSNQISEEVLSEFEDAYNVDVYINSVDVGDVVDASGSYIPLDVTERYIQTADVLMVGTDYGFSPFIDVQQTLAGYYLNLEPLISADVSIDSNNYAETIWRSFSWTRGMWAIPSYIEVEGILINSDFFEQNQIPLPSGLHGIDSWAILLDTLSSYTETPIYNAANEESLILSLLGNGIVSVDLQQPEFVTDEDRLVSILDAWSRSEIIQRSYSSTNATDLADFPLIYDTINIDLIEQLGYDLLLPPGEKPAIDVTGFAVSSLTEHPEIAYELAKYLSQLPQITTIGTLPAQYQPGADVNLPQISGETQTMLDEYIRSGFSPSEVQLKTVLREIVLDMINQPITATDAVSLLEERIYDEINLGIERNSDQNTIVINRPERTVVAEGEIVLHFGVDLSSDALENSIWDILVSDFVASNDHTDHIDISLPDHQFGEILNVDTFTDQFDCFYSPKALVHPFGVNSLTDLSPLIAADASWNPDIYPRSILDELRYSDRLWGIPISLYPIVSFVRPELSEQFGLSLNINQIENFLPVITDTAGIQSLIPNIDSLLILMAAYGGMPIDYSTEPIEINLSSPETAESIRSVINLIDSGKLAYNGSLASQNTVLDYSSSIYFAPYQFASMLNDYIPATTPIGNDETLMSMDIGTAYISNNTLHAEQCYDFIRYIAEHADVFGGIPFDTSSVLGEDQEDFRASLWEVLNNTEVVIMHSQDIYNAYLSVVKLWLGQVFDQAATNPGYDLEDGLREIQIRTDNFQLCIDNISVSIDDMDLYLEQYANCLFDADPELRSMLGD